MRKKFYDTAVKQEKAVLVGIVTPDETDAQEREYLEELEFLVDTAGGDTVKTFTQKVQRPDRATFVGSGKLEEIRDSFAQAARLAMRAGMDGVEIHACHGFFLDEFLWAETNLREDRYGGPSISDRLTYPAEVISAVSDAVGPDAILSIRLSQWKEADYDAQIVANPDELKVLTAAMAHAGANLLHMSCRRFYEPAFAGSDLGLAGWTKAVSTLPVITVGSVGLASDVMSALVGTPSAGLELEDSLVELIKRFDRQEFDLVAVGRSLIADPEWAAKVRAGNLQSIRPFQKDDLGKALEMEPEAIKQIHA